MTNFERITASPEDLAAFLESLPCVEGPWEEAFCRAFCKTCIAEIHLDNCPGVCPNEAYRNNPEWWLKLEAERLEEN